MSKVNQIDLNLAVCRKCGIHPRMKFNDRYTLFCFCPTCKQYVKAERNESFLEVAKKWNEIQKSKETQES